MLTIASPNTDRSLLTLAELRGAAGVADNSRDAELTALGDYVSAMITKACKVQAAGNIPPTLREETVQQTIRFQGRRQSFTLARRPVVSIATVTENGSEISDSNYEYDASAGLLYRLNCGVRSYWFFDNPHHLVVEYTAGWATVPADLKYAAIKYVKAEITTGSRDPLLKRVRIDGVSEREFWVDPKKDDSVPSDVMSILIRGGYVNMVVA